MAKATIQIERREFCGIRVILCGYADFAWDPARNDGTPWHTGWVSTNSDYVRNGSRNPIGIRWDVRDADELAIIAPHAAWLRREGE